MTFNHVGDALVLNHITESTIRIIGYPSLQLIHTTPAHVGGCAAIAIDPRGRYAVHYYTYALEHGETVMKVPCLRRK